jgi:PKD repeat protein
MMLGQAGWPHLATEAAQSAGSGNTALPAPRTSGSILTQVVAEKRAGTAATGDKAKAVLQAAVGDYLIQVDPALHKKFGLYYPATYKFRLPAGAHDLVAQYRYSDGPWVNLPEKKSGDLFSGMDAARFDYANAFAYVSVRFSLSSDNIYLRIIDSAGAPVSVVFDSIPKYYDNRNGAVAITVDDWNFAFDAPFRTATDYLASRNFYFSVALIAADIPWPSVQEKINQYGDVMELASHSLHHPCSASAYQTSGYQAETAGSRDAITGNLTFPNYPYVSAYIEPCGYSDSSLYSAISGANYLVERSSNDSFATASRFIEWDAVQQRYGRAGVTYNDTPPGDTPALLTEANAAFDKAMAAGGIYSLEDHPYNGYWHDGSYLLQHLDHIQGRSDVWYVPFGQMYQYHFLQEMRGNLSIQQLPPAAVTANFSANQLVGNVPLKVSFTDTSVGTVTQWRWDFGDGSSATEQNPQHTYLAAGSYTVTLTVSGPQGSNTITQPNYIKAGAPTPPVVPPKLNLPSILLDMFS